MGDDSGRGKKIVQTRLLASAAGGLLGACLTSVTNGFGLGPTLGLVACTLAGLTLGYVSSMLIDVFRM